MYNYHLYLVLKQRAFWCVVKQHIKICVKSEDIDLHTLSVLKQHTCFYSDVNLKCSKGNLAYPIGKERERKKR